MEYLPLYPMNYWKLISPRFLIKWCSCGKEKDIQACHHLKGNNRAIIKFSNRKDNLQVLRVKKYLKSLDLTEWDFPASPPPLPTPPVNPFSEFAVLAVNWATAVTNQQRVCKFFFLIGTFVKTNSNLMCGSFLLL